jgi:hypothetical protein
MGRSWPITREAFEFRRINCETLPQCSQRLAHDDDMNDIATAAKESVVSSLLWCFQCAYGTYGAQWDTVAIERRQGPAQVLDYAGLSGGPWSIWTDPPVFVRIKLK